ncbi:hypothetical protein [Sphingomonas sp. HMP6]|uniref:hypothetical protein n=1 Tax=Sphingomonas sp. HMP6 TaxID=1517551 RepID=UPI00159684B6|nr:hypothetical protein [Sphingomonas sp. HMP6]BCA57684.1 hypothetical protein HMP06_0453 [Sphingomonas sp. HMP6]
MAQYGFGSGNLWGSPTTDAYGTALATSTPILFGVLQEASIEVSFDLKELYGQNQFPVAVGRGKGKISGKAKFAQMNGLLINSLFFGQTLTTGILSDVYDTTGAVIPSTPFTITPTIPGSGTFAVDLGVRDANGIPMRRVVSGPTTGQYSLAAGAYTFATADATKVVYISYQYTATSTVAQKSSVINLPMGYAPTFRCDFYSPFNGKSLTITLPACISSKMMFATKLDDFVVPEFDFSGFADAAGNIITYALSE